MSFDDLMGTMTFTLGQYLSMPTILIGVHSLEHVYNKSLVNELFKYVLLVQICAPYLKYIINMCPSSLLV